MTLSSRQDRQVNAMSPAPEQKISELILNSTKIINGFQRFAKGDEANEL